MARPVYAPSLADDASAAPLFLRIARGISADIRRGVLTSGARLPGSRALAAKLGVHRNTALAAIAELASQGWVTCDPRRGTFVSDKLPESRPRPTERRTRSGIARDLPEPAPLDPLLGTESGVLQLIGGTPDHRLVPTTELARAYRRALARSPELLGYGSPWGDARLRRALAGMLRDTRSLPVEEERLLITRGSQMALFLLGKALWTPGSVIAVEGLGYRPAWESFKLAGARVTPLNVDDGGLDITALSTLLAHERVAAVYVTPHHQYPTTVTLTAPRRLALVELARRYRFTIIEDDYDHEHHYDGRAVLPIASLDAQVVAYVGTLSKVFAPGARIGYLTAPPEILDRAARFRMCVDRAGDLVVERALAELIEDDWLGRHVRRVRRAYEARRDALVHELRQRLDGALSFRAPAGGMSLWARVVPPDVSSDAWAERALVRKVRVHPARRFRFDGREAPFLRLGFAPHTPEEIRLGVERLARALR